MAWKMYIVLQGFLKPHHQINRTLEFHCCPLRNTRAALNLTRILLILSWCWPDCHQQRQWLLCAVSGKHCKSLKAVYLQKVQTFWLVFSHGRSKVGLFRRVCCHKLLHALTSFLVSSGCRIHTLSRRILCFSFVCFLQQEMGFTLGTAMALK